MQDAREAQLRQEIHVLESTLLARRKELEELMRQKGHSNFHKMAWSVPTPCRWNTYPEACE